MSTNETEQKQRILIVDDSEMNRSILADMLEEYQIIEAENGEEAVSILKEQVNDIVLVLLDIVMPKMDGFGVLEIMQKNRWLEQVPVIMISAESDSGYVTKAYEMGVTDFIARPFDSVIVRKRAVNTMLLYTKQKRLTEMVDQKIREIEEQKDMMIGILSHLVECRNGESAQHIINVRTITEILLQELQKQTIRYEFSPADISVIGMASSLHDIGKIAINSDILNKPGKLTEEEFEIMKTHSMLGADMLDNLPNFEDEPLVRKAYEICRWHHERYDGRGYPDGLKGDEIPICAQIVSIADVYDALTSKRVYKDAFSHEKAMEMIMEGQCGAFNPLLLKCLRNVEDKLKQMLAGTLDISRARKRQETALDEVRSKKLVTSERSLRLLDFERRKHDFFAIATGEMLFEYTAATDTVTLSEWSAKRMGIPEVIEDPGNNADIDWAVGRDNWTAIAEGLRKTTKNSPLIHYEVQLPVDGERRWHKISVAALWSGEEMPRYMGAMGKAVDIQDSLIHLQDLENRANHDTLTGLLNHSCAKREIQKKLKEKADSRWALIIMDLDRFKSANDNYGHLFGDKVLKYVSEKLRKNTNPGDIVARVGGDEFLIFTEYSHGFEKRVKKTFSALIGAYEDFPVRTSMGIAITTEAGNNYELLFHMADQALYSAKRAGRTRYLFYDGSMHGTFSAISPIDKDDREKNEKENL